MSSDSKKQPFSMNRFLLKVKYSFYSMLVFFIFANPETLKLLQMAFGRFVTLSGSDGLPTTLGLFSMAGLFFATMLGLMMLPSD
jgi:hypothetical protein